MSRGRRDVFYVFLLLIIMQVTALYPYFAYSQTQTTPPPPVPREELLYTGRDKNKSFYCPNYSGVLVERIVNCFVGVKTPGSGGRDGVFTMVVKRFLSTKNNYMSHIATAMITLAIVLHGAKIALGMGGTTGLQKDTVILLLKIGGVYYFLDNALDIYNDVMSIMFGLLEVVSDAAGVNLCPTASAEPNLWRQFDCMLDKVLGYSGGATILGGMIGMAVAFIFSAPVGIFIFLAILSFVVNIIFSVLRAIQVYMMAVLGLSFMFLLSPIFVPMILFGSTYNYFNKWLMTLTSYALMPVIMFAFMWLAVAVIDVSIFSGRYSVFGTITGGQQNNSKAIGYFVADSYEEPTNVLSQRTDTNPSKDDVEGREEVVGGLLGSKAKVQSIRAREDDQYFKWLDTTAVNEEKLAAKANATDSSSYMRDVFMSVVGAAMLLYVIYSMNSHIPSITAHLLATSGGIKGIAQSKVIGQKTVTAGIKAAKAATKAASGNVKGGGGGATKAPSGNGKGGGEDTAKSASKSRPKAGGEG